MPTLLHFTHVRSGSTWVDGILRYLFAELTLPQFGAERFEGNSSPQQVSGAGTDVDYLAMYSALPVKQGHVYPGLMLTREEFLQRPEFREAKRFVVIRDLRDALISHYFSLVREAREKLNVNANEARSHAA